MNYSIIIYILGWILNFEAAFMVLPCIVAVVYKEKAGLAFLIVACICLVLGLLITRKKPKNASFYAKEGFVTVGLSWIVLSVMGAIPFVINKDIPNFTNALFETISGFTTTGTSILDNVEGLTHCSLFWRSFTHWIGGMGVLVFILAILKIVGGQTIHLMRAESPGPSVGKLVPRLKTTAIILYAIYFTLTLIEFILLLFAKMPVFDALTTSLGTAGTGGFGIKNDSIASYSPAIQNIVTIFMIMFGVNFNVYFLLLVKKPKDALKCEELRYYLGIILISALLITMNIKGMYSSFGEAFHHSIFQVGSIITTTGFSTVDFNYWPEFSKTIIVLLMFVGACAGSTGGGIKVSRVLIFLKTLKKEINHFIHPRNVKKIKIEGKPIEHEVVRSVNVFLVAYIVIFVLSLLIISLDNFDFTTNFTAIAATLNNIGPGLNLAGPANNFSFFSPLSKYVMMFDMLAGRLEIFPILLLLCPAIWKNDILK